MPFEAAKAIAATFCWKIRYALTPVFGPEFPEMCLRPESEGFGTMVIDPAITERCTEQAHFYRQLEVETSTGTATVMRSPLTPESPSLPRNVKQLRPKVRQFASARSGYSSDSSFDDNCASTSVSPTLPYCNTWTPANTPRSTGPSFHGHLPSPRQILAGMSTEAMDSDEEDHKSAASVSTSSTTSLLLKSRPEAHEDDDDEHNDDTGSVSSSSIAVSTLPEVQEKSCKGSVMSDEKAAYLLLKLNMEAGMNEAPRVGKRRAST